MLKCFQVETELWFEAYFFSNLSSATKKNFVISTSQPGLFDMILKSIDHFLNFICSVASRLKSKLATGVFSTSRVDPNPCAFLESFFTVAYFVGYAPYRIRRSCDGRKYFVSQWWPQKVMHQFKLRHFVNNFMLVEKCENYCGHFYQVASYIMNIVFLYSGVKRCHDFWSLLMTTMRQGGRNGPSAYLKLIESILYTFYTTTLICTIIFRAKRFVFLLNKFAKYTNQCQPHASPCHQYVSINLITILKKSKYSKIMR